ncbi:MAG: FtsX-like permease family protein [Nocardiopsaceae bacterium]|nr:FtsX-like permease family protein [Nocardiopsaceae bacterium]
MSTPVLERPGSAADRVGGGGVPARRAVIRWALRMLRREWRQQVLILALITAAVGATVVASTVATDTPAPIAGVLGTASDAASLSGPSAKVNSEIAKIQGLYGKTDVIENESVPVPGTVNTFYLRAQNPHGPFGGPMLSLISGKYPATAGQVAVTSGVATDFHLSAGSTWTVAGKARKVTGIVQNPESLLDEFALVLPGQVTNPSSVTVLFDSRQSAASIQKATGLTVTTAQAVANTNPINPETISIAAAVLGMLLIALVGVGGFTVLAQRRLRAIGMLAAQGATERHIRLVVRANGLATGVVGAVAGFALGFLAWLAYRPHAETSAHHLMGVFQMPWTVIVISMALAVVAAYFAASRPAKAIARVPVTQALSGRPPEPKKTRHLAIPIGIGFGVAAFLLLGAAGAGIGGDGGGGSMGPLVLGFVVLAVAIVLLAPACLSVVAAAGRRSPISVRLALRDLARYRARSGPALAAIALSTLIAVIICVASAARFSNDLDYAGPNLASSQLAVWTPAGPYAGMAEASKDVPASGNPKGSGPKGGGPDGQVQSGPPPVSTAQAHRVADKIAAALGTSPASMLTLESTSATLIRAAPGRNWSGPIFVATPQLLNAFGIKQSQINPDADILTMRPGMSTMSLMKLAYGRPTTSPPSGYASCPTVSCVANPPIQEIGQLPSGTSAPNTVITERAISTLHLQNSVTTSGWLITLPKDLTTAQIAKARQLAAGAPGMSVETRNSIPSLAQIIDVATIFGILLALSILGMSVGLVRSEAARDLRTLTATGAAPRTRRTITAATAGALAFTGAVIGIAGGYLAAIGFFRSNSLDGLSSLSAIPVSNLLAIGVGMPLAAVVIGWLIAGRDPANVSRQPLE